MCRKWWIRGLSIFLAIVLAITGLWFNFHVSVKGDGGIVSISLARAQSSEIIALRTAISKTFDLGGGKYQLEVSSGVVHYKDANGQWQEIDNNIVATPLPWNYQMTKADYTAKFLSNLTAGQVVEVGCNGQYTRFQPMALQWTNDLAQIQQVSMPVNVPVSVSGNSIKWTGGYGSGRSMEYQCAPSQLVKTVVINSLANLPAPPAYIINGGNPVLELNFVHEWSSGVTPYINGVQWDKKTQTETQEIVEFRNGVGETLFVYDRPIYRDSAVVSDIGIGTERFKKQGSSFYVSIRIPYSWLQTATYPVYIDPSPLIIQPSAKDTYLRQDAATTNYGSSVNLRTDSALTAVARRSILEFDISGLPSGQTLTSGSLQLYYYLYGGSDPVGQTVWAYKQTHTDWVELEATWNIYKTGSNWTTAGSDWVTSNPAGGSTTIPAAYGWVTWNVLAIVQDAYAGSIAAEFLVKLATEEATTRQIVYYSNNYVTDTTKCPKLTIAYEASGVPAITVSPGTSDFGVVIKNSTPNTTNAWFTITNDSTMTVDINIKCNGWTHQTGSHDWTYGTPIGADKGFLKASSADGGVGGSTGEGNYDITVLNGSDTLLCDGVITTVDPTLELQLNAPSSFTHGDIQQTIVTLTAIAD